MAPVCRKVGSLKRRVRSQLARGEMKNCAPLWREAHFEVKMYAVVARSTFLSQNVQNTPAPDHFWHLRCRKIARGCGAKDMSKSKGTKHLSVGRLLEAEMWEKVHAVVARSAFRSQHVKKTRGSDHFWKFRSRKSARRCGAKHILKPTC